MLTDEERKISKRAAVKRTETKLRLEIFELLGGKCVDCGLDDVRCLEIEHTNNDGGYWRKTQGHRVHNRKIRAGLREGKNPYAVEAVCANCHSIRTWH